MEISRVTQGGAASMNVKEVEPVQAVKSSNPVSPHEQPQKNTTRENILSKEEAQKAVDGFNKLMQDSHLKFTYHDQLGEYYVAIVDSITDEVIREIPPKKLLDMVAGIREFLGLVVDRKI